MICSWTRKKRRARSANTTAVVAAKPLDQARRAIQSAARSADAEPHDDAKEHLLLALEAAPGYKPAQKIVAGAFTLRNR